MSEFRLSVQNRAVEVPKKRRLKRRLLQAPQAPFKAPIHSKCCIGGFRETGLALVIVLRCDWPLCDLRFKSYQHLKLKIFISMHTAGTWWIFQPKSSEKSTENACVNSSPPALSQTLCTVQYFWIQSSPVLPTAGVELLNLKSISNSLLGQNQAKRKHSARGGGHNIIFPWLTIFLLGSKPPT